MSLSIKQFTPIYHNGKLDKNKALEACVSDFATTEIPLPIEDKVLESLGSMLQYNCVYSNVKWKNNYRNKKNSILEDIRILIFDIDNALTLDEIHQSMKVKMMTLTTTSHTPTHHKFRVIIPLKTPLSFTSPLEYIEFLKLVNEELFDSKVDKACLEPARAYITTTSAKYRLNNIHEYFNPNDLLKKAKAQAVLAQLPSVNNNTNINTHKPSIQQVKEYKRTQELVAEFGKGNHYEPVYKIIGIGKISGLSNEECAKLIMSYNLPGEYSNFNDLVKKAQTYDKH